MVGKQRYLVKRNQKILEIVRARPLNLHLTDPKDTEPHQATTKCDTPDSVSLPHIGVNIEQLDSSISIVSFKHLTESSSFHCTGQEDRKRRQKHEEELKQAGAVRAVCQFW